MHAFMKSAHEMKATWGADLTKCQSSHLVPMGEVQCFSFPLYDVIEIGADSQTSLVLTMHPELGQGSQRYIVSFVSK